MSKLLVIDDEQAICWGVSKLGKSLGHEVLTASSAEQALQIVQHDSPDVVVLDVRLPGMDGLTAMDALRRRIGQVPIIIITAYGDLPTAVEAVRNGAFEYLVKPFDLDQMRRVLTRACEPADRTANDVPPVLAEGIVGKTPAMQEVFKRIALAATSDACVLLHGESGTGKELAARAIHRFSSRAAGPFVAVNLAALSPQLAESELFGHVRGAFTDASEDRVGLLAQAHGGTLFLDEVADIPLAAQVKLLRVLDHGEVLPVGANRTIQTDFRVISATHQDLLERVNSGAFRHDLYFRLSAFPVELPSLRERRDDIAELASHFATRQAGTASLPVFAEETITELCRRPWYGNVRELRNAVEHAIILARGARIQPEHLPPALAAPFTTTTKDLPLAGQLTTMIRQWTEAALADAANAGTIYEKLLQLVEPPFLQTALNSHRGQCAAAARALGIHRVTLRNKLNQYGIEGE